MAHIKICRVASIPLLKPPQFTRDTARLGLLDDEVTAIVDAIAADRSKVTRFKGPVVCERFGSPGGAGAKAAGIA